MVDILANTKNSHYYFLIISIGLILLLNCMESYFPQSNWEQREYFKSNFEIQPHDLTSHWNEYKSVNVAWVGIIQESEFYENPDNYEVLMLMEHRYFDWNVDFSKSEAKYFISTKGEGLFQTRWYLTKDADLLYFMDRFGKGNLAIVYATPDTVINNIVLVKSRFVRIIDKNHFNANQFDYVPPEIEDRNSHP